MSFQEVVVKEEPPHEIVFSVSEVEFEDTMTIIPKQEPCEEEEIIPSPSKEVGHRDPQSAIVKQEEVTENDEQEENSTRVLRSTRARKETPQFEELEENFIKEELDDTDTSQALERYGEYIIVIKH